MQNLHHLKQLQTKLVQTVTSEISSDISDTHKYMFSVLIIGSICTVGTAFIDSWVTRQYRKVINLHLQKGNCRYHILEEAQKAWIVTNNSE